MLETNPETVRRWIRKGKLKAEKNSRKEGNTITQDALLSFFKATPKYSHFAKRASTMSIPSVEIPLFIGTTVASILIQENEIKNANVSSKELIAHIRTLITERESAIKQKQNTINQLEKEIVSDKQRIEELMKALKTLLNQDAEKNGEE